ncbi:archaeosortase/exosortase family protein [Engelhardtia mirabilis]|uniref:Transmembrane exosortase (Exosortase_EpsH) n=1 Tax=Engelhardtia mirabilis TaxID=2528011 RepID=A0A518BQR1_9BACT|nr:Transmembrane exosortase (Exosortase_EpsH) [Planctomycetes bacterium Pla133]QDV03640.1 Transmembrane exosortase (Exosortase_EpsH) [Planctomycetes bacterium Pla86]
MSRTAVVLLAVVAHWPAWWWAGRTAEHTGDLGLHGLAAATFAALVFRALRRPASGAAVDLRAPAVGLALSSVLGLAIGGLAGALSAVAATVWIVSRLATERRFHLGLFGLGLLALPLLPIFELQLGPALRLPAAQGAATLLRTAGFHVEAMGTVLSHPGGEVWVDPPCAGIAMLWTALFVGLAAGTIRGWSNARLAFTAGLATAAVLLGNAWRVAALFVLETSPWPRPAWLHGATGLAIEALVLAAVLLLGAPRRERGGAPCVVVAHS